MSGPRERLRNNVTSATGLVVIGLSVLAYAAGLPNVWVLLFVGLLVVTPLVGLLVGDDDWRKWDPLSDEFWEDIFGEESTETVETPEDEAEAEPDPLLTLREQYARGELTDEGFERRLELLLETESLADVERHLERAGDEREHERTRAVERER